MTIARTSRSIAAALLAALVAATAGACAGASCDALVCPDGVELLIGASSYTVTLPEHACSFDCLEGVVANSTCAPPHEALLGVECRADGAFVVFQDAPPATLQVQVADHDSSASFDGEVAYTVDEVRLGEGGDCPVHCQQGAVMIEL